MDDFQSASEYLRSVVRVFPDLADTVLWFAGGPVDYEDAHLSPELTRDMQAWEDYFYANSNGYWEWHSGDPKAWDSEGSRLSERLSDELGDVVGVEYRSRQEGVEMMVFRGVGYGTNAEARATFQAMIEQSLKHDEIQAKLRAAGKTGRYSIARRPKNR